MKHAGIGFRGLALAGVGVLCVGIGLAAAATSMTPGAKVDQSYPWHQTGCTGYIPSPGGWIAQTFTAGLTGSLTDVSLDLHGPEAPEVNDYTVAITSVDSSGAPLLSLRLTSTLIRVLNSPDDHYVPVTFSRGAQVQAGKRYALVLMRPASNDSFDRSITWRGDTGATLPGRPTCASGSYDGGAGLTSDGPISSADADFYFFTYVVPATAPPPQATTTTVPKAKAKPKAKKPPFCKKGQRSTKAHPCRKR